MTRLIKHTLCLCFMDPSDRHICKSSEELHEERVQRCEGPARQSG